MKAFEEQFTAWVDGQLTGEELAEFERELASRPEAAADKDDALRLRRLLREVPAAPALANADFFNLQIMQKIEAGQERPQTAAGGSAAKAGWMWPLSRLVWAGAFCLLVAFGLFKTLIPTETHASARSPYFAQVIEAWPADSSISATTVYNPEDNVTVLWLEGLDYVQLQ